MYDFDRLTRDFDSLALYLENCLMYYSLTPEQRAQAEADIKTCDEGQAIIRKLKAGSEDAALLQKLEAIRVYVNVWGWDDWKA